jgi:hypothetical protein
MQSIKLRELALAAALLAGAGSSTADTIVTVGHQDFFTSGALVGSGTFSSAKQADTPKPSAPFDGNYIGADVTANDNFAATWTFTYAKITDTLTSGTFTLGILDDDAATSGNQVASFTLGGVNLTAELNTTFENAVSNGTNVGKTGHYDIYTLSLSSSVLAALKNTSSAQVQLSLQNGGGALGSTPSNGAALDFSTLNLSTQTLTTPVPVPGALWLFLTGVSALISVNKKRSIA